MRVMLLPLAVEESNKKTESKIVVMKSGDVCCCILEDLDEKLRKESKQGDGTCNVYNRWC